MADVVPLSEAEWATSDELWRMLHYTLGLGVFTARKQLLFAATSCLTCGGPLPPEYEPVLESLLHFAERTDFPVLPSKAMFNDRGMYQSDPAGAPDRHAQEAILAAARDSLYRRCAKLLPPDDEYYEGRPGFEIDDRVFYAVCGHVFAAAHGDGNGSIARSRAEADILREVFGNPFRPIAFALWRTDTATALARGMYESRDFGAMPILADALQDAGCDNPDVLAHCRDPHATHVRGCWVIDGVLGKE